MEHKIQTLALDKWCALDDGLQAYMYTLDKPTTQPLRVTKVVRSTLPACVWHAN